ncbi:MAG: hypothetical protein KDE27_02980 [Planctomycetes bacterium]|nr:hypothetical protein [Planctomycetota bacterium]
MKPYIEVDKPSNPMYLRLASSQWDTCAHWVAMKAAVIAADAGYLLPAGDLFNIKDGRIPPDARIEYMPSSVAADAYGVVVHGIRSKETGDLRCAVVAIRFTGQMFRYAWAGIPGKRLKSGGAFLTWSVQPRTKVPIMQWAEDLVKRGFRRFESYMKELDEFASDVDLEDVPPGEGTNVDGVG